MNQNDRATKVADAAAAVQERARFDSPAYAYAAGVEDALRWITGSVSPNVFLGTMFDTDKAVLAPLAAAAHEATP